MAFDIKNRWDDTIVYHSELTLDLRAAVLEALDSGANLSDAYLSGANLRAAERDKE